MTDPLQRRVFIKSVALTGASIAMADSVFAKTFFSADSRNEIKNRYFTISFDSKKGVFNIYRADGNPLLTGATSCINYNKGKHFVSPDNYKFTVTSKVFTDQAGSGKVLIILSKSRNKKTDVETWLSLYDNIPAVTIETIYHNVSQQDIFIKTMEPLRVIKQEGGNLHVPGVSKCITNGEMYFDTGTIHEFGNTNNGITSGSLKGVKLSNGLISSESETIHSWWNAALFSGYENEAISIGYLDNNNGLGNLLISKTDAGKVSFIAETAYAPEVILKPGKAISSNRVMINLSNDPYTLLELFADTTGKLNNARCNSVVNGWCSWFYTLAKVSEAEVIANTEFAEKNLKQFGLTYIQIDEGYQRWHGEWEGNERFPHGMKWLAGKIRSHGFKAGIWISPYVVAQPAAVFQQHPEWFLKGPDGSPMRVGNWAENETPPADENPKRYCLDITHPDAAKWLHELIDRIVNDWGYEMIKIDFVAWSILAAARYHDPTVSSAHVYRMGMEIMRKAAGDKCHILECGPGAATVGLIDSMRIELDANYGFADTAWLTYFTDPACSMTAMAKRYYFHKRTWINDADHICLDLMNEQQSEAVVTLIALSGGNMMSGDRLTQLDPYKLGLLKKITPSSGEAARPVDLFDSDMPSVFALKVKKSFAEWTVVGFFNASLTETIEKKFPLKRLWLNSDKTYIAFDFWKQEFAGVIKDEIKVTVQPGSVTLLALHEKTGHPQIISTDRHVLQGNVETDSVNWNETTKTLSGLSTGGLNTSYNVYVYLPDEHPWTWGGSAFYRDYEGYSLKLTGSNIIRVNLRFEKAEKLQWEIKYDEFK